MRTSALIVVVLVTGCYSGAGPALTSAESGAAGPSSGGGGSTGGGPGGGSTGEASGGSTSAPGETDDPSAAGPTTAGPGSSGEPAPSCGDLAAAQGWPAAVCEAGGDGACGGHGPATPDCDHCCAGLSCPDHAAASGWHASVCEVGDGACGGQGPPTTDCDRCCPGPSCGDVAAQSGWTDPLCEQGDDICEGTGAPTWDCTRCCDGAALPVTGGFGYPVGDRTSYPAGGWSIGQVMAHYLDGYGGRHLAHDVNHPDGGPATVDAPVHAVADGVVRYAGPNGSSYKNVVLIEHEAEDGGGEVVCSFYGHVNPPLVSTGDVVTRGQQVTTVKNWAECFEGGSVYNTHLHYAILRKPLCDASAAANGALVCGYDKGGPNDVFDLASEPYSYQPVADICGDSQYGDVFLSPTQFIEAHHF